MLSKNYLSVILSGLILLGGFYPGEVVADNLEFTISSVKESYFVAEPVFIGFTLKNQNSVAVQLSPEITVETEFVSLFIASGQNAFQLYHPGFVVEPSLREITLTPSQAIVHRQLVLYNASTKDYAFPKTGIYRIQAIYHRFGSAPDVQSNTIEIRVTEPTGIDAEALQLFMSKEVAGLIMNVNEDMNAVKNLELLMTRYQATTYGKYAQFYLARRQTQEFFARKPSYERAITLYQDLIQRDPKFPLSTEINYGLGLSLMKIKNYDEAKQKLNLVLKESQETKYLKGAERSLQQINQYEQGKERNQ